MGRRRSRQLQPRPTTGASWRSRRWAMERRLRSRGWGQSRGLRVDRAEVGEVRLWRRERLGFPAADPRQRLAEQLRTWTETIKKTQLDAIRAYTVGGKDPAYLHINESLKEGTEMSPKDQKTAHGISAALKSSAAQLDKPMTVL